jgi:exopolysaccharide biosynthesis protein
MRNSRPFGTRRHRAYAVAAAAAALPLLAITPPGSAAATTAAATAPGDSWISQVKWTSQQIAPGATVRDGVLSSPAVAPYWTVTIDASVTSSITGQPANAELGSPSWAAATASKLQSDGYTPMVQAVDWPDYSDTPHGLEGMRVRTGDFSTQSAAQSAATALQGLGFTTATVEWTGYDADQAPDGEQIHEAIIDPRLARIEVTHHGIVAQRQTTSSVAAALHALVAANAGFFITSNSFGFQGVPDGVAVYDGQLESMNNGPRAALIIDHGRPRIANLEASVTVRAGRASYPVNGINRIPGIVQDCGRPGSEPTSQPRQDITCTESSELVLFTGQFGAATPSGSGTQAVLGPDGTVLSAGPQTGGNVPVGGSVIQGIGAAGAWLAQHTVTGQRLFISERITDTAGHTIPLSQGVSVASAAPVLLQNGHAAIDAASEGVINPADLTFNFAWAEDRQPRTIAGIDRHGRLVLVTVDGRQPGVSEGAPLTEEASLMRSLGAVSAMNLDGGGSTAMAVNGALVNRTSDATGERADGDFVVVLPPAA